MNTHIIEGGVVINTICAPITVAQELFPDAVCLDSQIYSGAIGWTWDGERLHAPQADVNPSPVAARKCSPAQGLTALYAVKSITDADVRAAIEQIPDDVQRYTARVAFERATEWVEDSPTMQLMQGMLGLSDEDMQELFDYAETVRA